MHEQNDGQTVDDSPDVIVVEPIGTVQQTEQPVAASSQRVRRKGEVRSRQTTSSGTHGSNITAEMGGQEKVGRSNCSEKCEGVSLPGYQPPSGVKGGGTFPSL